MKSKLLILSVIAVPLHSSYAEDAPSVGIVYNSAESPTYASALRYECSRNRDAKLHCKFVQMSIRHLAAPKDEEIEIEKARKFYRKGKEKDDPEGLKKSCADMEKNKAAIETGVPPPDANDANVELWKKVMALPARRKMLLEWLALWSSFCQKPTEANFLKISRHDFLTKTKTCQISSNPFEQDFTYFRSTNTWVVTQEGPQGVCGIVNVSKFVQEKSFGPTFWKYVAKKVVTNKEGKVLLRSCSDLDESEQTFDWRSVTRFMKCERVEFGP